MTKFKFVMSVLWGTVAALTVILIFTVYAVVIFFGSLRWVDTTEASYRNNLVLEKVIYRTDKIFYQPEETIVLDIINNTDESIFLAPCYYFNKFEKKVANGWQARSLETCDVAAASDNSASIEKINKKVEILLEAKKLGEGTWRGVSTVYFDCQKPEIKSCGKNSETIYTKEFMIGKSGSGEISNPQL